MAGGRRFGDGFITGNGSATAAIHEETHGLICFHGDQHGRFDGFIGSAIRNTNAAAFARCLSSADSGSSLLSRSAGLNSLIGHEWMEKAGKCPYFTVFRRDQLRALFDSLAVLRWIRCHRGQVLAKCASGSGVHGISVAAICLRCRVSLDSSSPVEEILRRSFSTPKKSVEHSLRFKRASLNACLARRLTYGTGHQSRRFSPDNPKRAGVFADQV